MTKLLLVLISLSLSLPSYAQEKVRALVKIEKEGQGVLLLHNTSKIMSVAGSPAVQKIINELKTGDEAMIEGHLAQHSNMGKLEKENLFSVFVIDDIRPVSLALLREDSVSVPEKDMMMKAHTAYIPMSIPVTTEIASALTLTGSMLLMQALTSEQNPSDVRNDISQGMILTAGAMTTFVFIYEQLPGIKRP